jgi:hypothetical protein
MFQQNQQNNPYKIDAPQYAPATEPVPALLEEGEIGYGNQNFNNTFINATSEILESGQKFWQDIWALNQQRLQLNAQVKASDYKEWRLGELERLANKAEKELKYKEHLRLMQEQMDIINGNWERGNETYGGFSQ